MNAPAPATTETARLFSFRVAGRPAPQGSKKAVGNDRQGRAILVESSKRVKPWRAAVHAAAVAALPADWSPLDGPVELTVRFYLRAPKRMPAGRTKPTTYPDLSKLIRSTEDALVTSDVLADDARIWSMNATKTYADDVQVEGALISVRWFPAIVAELRGARPDDEEQR